MTPDSVTQWYCLRVRPKQESSTAAVLRTEADMEVFSPRIRFKRARITGITWVNEAMFPGYIFAYFDYALKYRHVLATGGVSCIVKFGGEPAIVSTEIISDLRSAIADEETVEIDNAVQPGQEINVVAGPFRGVRALVTRVMPAKDRIAVLLEVLGMEREVELKTDTVLPDLIHPMHKGATETKNKN
ncbi:MAG: transcription termination/antitermination NusG family protein [Chthoniobacterales bacterium]